MLLTCTLLNRSNRGPDKEKESEQVAASNAAPGTEPETQKACENENRFFDIREPLRGMENKIYYIVSAIFAHIS